MKQWALYAGTSMSVGEPFESTVQLMRGDHNLLPYWYFRKKSSNPTLPSFCRGRSRNGPIKINEAKNCIMFAAGSHDNSASCLCVALKRQILIYELNRSKQRHHWLKVNTKVIRRKSTKCFPVSRLFTQRKVFHEACTEGKFGNLCFVKY